MYRLDVVTITVPQRARVVCTASPRRYDVASAFGRLCVGFISPLGASRMDHEKVNSTLIECVLKTKTKQKTTTKKKKKKMFNSSLIYIILSGVYFNKVAIASRLSIADLR